MRQLLPAAVENPDLDRTYTDPRRGPREGRPWVLVNMITSVDGATAIDGLSGGLGGPGDQAVFAVLRRLADVVLVGAETVRAERYGPPKRAGQRIVVVTRGAKGLDPAWPLFVSGAGIVAVPEDAPDVPAGLPLIRVGTGGVDLAALLPRLHHDLGAGVVLAEGGPGLNGQLLGRALVDEWCLTLSPRLVGGESSRVAAARVPAAGAHVEWDLAHVLEDAGALFLRYVRRQAPG